VRVSESEKEWRGREREGWKGEKEGIRKRKAIMIIRGPEVNFINIFFSIFVQNFGAKISKAKT